LTTLINGRTYLVGVVSWIDPACSLLKPDVFSRVTAKKDWILSNSDAADWQCGNDNY
jgi:hypothetical protein